MPASGIVSPYPPIVITVSINKQTGQAQITYSELIPFQMLVQTFSAIMLQAVDQHMKEAGVPSILADVSSLPFEVVVKTFCSLMLQLVQAHILQAGQPTFQKPPVS